MILGLMFMGLPIAIFGVVVSLPAGRPAHIGIAVTALVIALVWAGYPSGSGPLWTGVARADAMMFWVASLCTVAFVAAALTQTLGRWAVARLPGLNYPVAALLVLIAIGLPLVFQLAI